MWGASGGAQVGQGVMEEENEDIRESIARGLLAVLPGLFLLG